MVTDIINKGLYFGCKFLDYGHYHGNITSYDRQIYSYFRPKFLNIYTSFPLVNFFHSLPHYGNGIA